MFKIKTYQVFPNLPEPIRFLGKLSRNLWWTWNKEAIELFKRIEPALWEDSGRNPITFSTLIPQERLQLLAQDKSFLAHLEQVQAKYQDQVLDPLKMDETIYGQNGFVAYFSMEFGIHESLPLFAGGLGILAGDHLKASSNLKIPLIGIGLLYSEGYFQQYLDHNGWQQEAYPPNDLFFLPIRRATTPDHQELTVSIQGESGEIKAQVWELKAGRTRLLLLDTNITENPPEIRKITSRLYTGDPHIRVAQEALLGFGGMRALERLGIIPTACHLNEGHCTFVLIERLRQIMERFKVDLPTAKAIVPRTTILTTHTPVPAGYDEFPADLVKAYLAEPAHHLGLSTQDLLSWGQGREANPNAPFSMFVLGLRLSQYCNGVSELHGQVARKMWSNVWPGKPEHEVPISFVTNGVHIPSILSQENNILFERYLGPDWHEITKMEENIQRIGEIFEEELWQAHIMSKSRLIRTVREQLVKQHSKRNAPLKTIRQAGSVLDQETLTIGFARRFATYKRANLIFHNPERLKSLLTDPQRPIQIIFAGKAHPMDQGGKEIIQQIYHFSQQEELRHHLVFLENYDLHLARHLVQGVDIWLNTPRRPLEACGTSGMKAAINGVLNLSTLDGWWCEGYSPELGWAIGRGEVYNDLAYQDAVEAQALYNILEDQVIPTYYDRSPGGTPKRWVEMMKSSMCMLIKKFTSLRMVSEYETKFYIPACKAYNSMLAEQARLAKVLATQRERYLNLWKKIRIESPVRNLTGPFKVDQSFEARAVVHLGELTPEEVDIELYFGRVKKLNELIAPHTQPMQVGKDLGAGNYEYRCQVFCKDSGRYGFTVRALPKADPWIRNLPGLITWAD